MASATQSIREIISSQPTAAAILQRFDIDVCTHTNESLSEACAELQLSVEQVLEKLADGAAADAGATHPDLAEYSASRLIQHIVRIHHQSIRQELPRLAVMAGMVADKYGERVPELKLIAAAVEELRAEMAEHICKEEQVLFPYIAQVEETPLLAFRPQDHERARLVLEGLRTLSRAFRAPVWACSTFVAFYEGLRIFADTFDEHIRLENDVLFPRAIAMEAELMSRGAQ
jgi:regulator of cell morphogenesis and NO signaling